MLDDVGYDAVAVTLGFPHLDPFAPLAGDDVTALRSHLLRMRGGTGAAVVVETGTRYLLDPLHKHRPTLVDRDATAAHPLPRTGHRGRSGPQGPLRLVLLRDPARRRRSRRGLGQARGRIPELVEYAGERGVRLAIEPEPGMFVETVEDALRLLSDVGMPPSWGSPSTSGTAWSWSPTAWRGRSAPPRRT